MLPQCIQCCSSDAIEWQKTDLGIICMECYESNRESLKNELELEELDDDIFNEYEVRKIRKSIRKIHRNKLRNMNNNRGGKGRRNKNNPNKAPNETATTKKVDCLFYNGTYFQVGDIVSLMNFSGDTFYAQITGLLIDSFCEKSAVITWLIPTTSSPPPNERFDPATYLIGPAEDSPRKMSCIDFVMNAPSAYYYDNTTPFPPPETYVGGMNTRYHLNSNFIWANISPEDIGLDD